MSVTNIHFVYFVLLIKQKIIYITFTTEARPSSEVRKRRQYGSSSHNAHKHRQDQTESTGFRRYRSESLGFWTLSIVQRFQY
jgi:hypothetical protein